MVSISVGDWHFSISTEIPKSFKIADLPFISLERTAADRVVPEHSVPGRLLSSPPLGCEADRLVMLKKILLVSHKWLPLRRRRIEDKTLSRRKYQIIQALICILELLCSGRVGYVQ